MKGFQTIFDGSMKSRCTERDPHKIIIQGSKVLGLSISAESCHKLIRHIELLLKWNERINLTAVRDPVQACVLHVLDSLTIFKVLSDVTSVNVLDIGSGGGFPGMVMKIANESLRMTLLDRNPKKIVFLKHVAKDLCLSNITFLHMSFESLLARQWSSPFDVIVSRALSRTREFLASLHSLLSPGGSVIRMAGPSDEGHPEEIGNLILLDMWTGTLPFSTRVRSVYRYGVPSNSHVPNRQLLHGM
jgi:16S rRNA (guanine527-N7)-methyltransferase